MASAGRFLFGAGSRPDAHLDPVKQDLQRCLDLGVLVRQLVIMLELGDIAVDGCITKAPCGGEVAGRNPMDLGKQGRKRSMVVDANGIPLGAVAALARWHDSPLLGPTLDPLDALGPLPDTMTVHLDRGDYSGVTRGRLADRRLGAEIATRPRSPPPSAGP